MSYMASQKRNKNHTKHIKNLALAFELAKINLGSTKENPSVGCVIEKDGSIISSGYTSINGRPHAEYNALNKNINFVIYWSGNRLASEKYYNKSIEPSHRSDTLNFTPDTTIKQLNYL